MYPKRYTLQEVAQQADWVVISGKVLDISSFLDSHPGGREAIAPYQGRDATVAFKEKPHSIKAHKLLDEYVIGYLRDTTVETQGKLEVPVGKYRIFVVINDDAPSNDKEVLWQPLNKNVFKLHREFLAPEFLALMEVASTRSPAPTPAQFEQITVERNLTYSFPIFTEHFASQVLAEIEHYLQFTTRDPMGLMLKEFGFENFVRELLNEHVYGLIRLLFPQFSRARRFEDVYTKLVKYSLGRDEDWPIHEDVSDLTINICLSSGFIGTDLILIGTKEEGDKNVKYYKHRPGRLIMHLGANRHGVTWLKTGTRYSLITLLERPLTE